MCQILMHVVQHFQSNNSGIALQLFLVVASPALLFLQTLKTMAGIASASTAVGDLIDRFCFINSRGSGYDLGWVGGHKLCTTIDYMQIIILHCDIMFTSLVALGQSHLNRLKKPLQWSDTP